jgi:hypothetical protein
MWSGTVEHDVNSGDLYPGGVSSHYQGLSVRRSYCALMRGVIPLSTRTESKRCFSLAFRVYARHLGDVLPWRHKRKIQLMPEGSTAQFLKDATGGFPSPRQPLGLGMSCLLSWWFDFKAYSKRNAKLIFNLSTREN